MVEVFGRCGVQVDDADGAVDGVKLLVIELPKLSFGIQLQTVGHELSLTGATDACGSYAANRGADPGGPALPAACGEPGGDLDHQLAAGGGDLGPWSDA